MDPVRVSLYGLYPTTRWRYLGRQALLFVTVLGMFLLALAAPSPEEFAKGTTELPPVPPRIPPSPTLLLLAANTVGLSAPPGIGTLGASVYIVSQRPPKHAAPLTTGEVRDARSGVSRTEVPTAVFYGRAIVLFSVLRWFTGFALLALAIETGIMLSLFARKAAERASAPSSPQP